MSMKHAQTALSLAQSTGNNGRQSDLFRHFAFVKFRIGDYTAGQVYAKEAHRLARITGYLQKEKLGIHKGLQFMGDIFLQENDEVTAISLFMLALQGFTLMDVHCSRAECMVRLGDISEKNGDLLSALELWEMARPLFERSSQTKQIQAIDERMSRVNKDVKEQHLKNLAHLVELSVPAGRMDEEDEEDSEIELELDEAEVERVML
ncbi:hypothetical protein B0H16DRAFT_1722626 [Mycena metata]|uniref:Uncharacterized protein n=1 Tax=Mycena metata TaxID=1033252 RepID=A0AAD7J3P6_9AGAR|nr:hypothetical protein B0H16DRAFT_1722626 [Mycena metata]